MAAALSFYSGHLLWKGSNIKYLRHLTDTIYVTHKIHDSSKAKIKLLRIKSPVNTDSLWKEAVCFAESQLLRHASDDSLSNYNFTACMDTFFQKSKVNLSLRFHSPIPLHPKSYFTIDISYLSGQLIIPPEEDRSFGSRFNYSLNVGFGYGILKKNCDIFIGLGGSFRL